MKVYVIEYTDGKVKSTVIVREKEFKRKRESLEESPYIKVKKITRKICGDWGGKRRESS